MTMLNICPPSSPPHSRVISGKVMPIVSAVSIFTDRGGNTNAQANGTGTSAATTDSTATIQPPANVRSEHTDKDDSNNPRGLTGSESENSVATPLSRSDGSHRKKPSFQAAAVAVRFGATIFKGTRNPSSNSVTAHGSTDEGQAVARARFNPSKALQKAAHKLTVTRAFQVDMNRAAAWLVMYRESPSLFALYQQQLTGLRCLGRSRST